MDPHSQAVRKRQIGKKLLRVLWRRCKREIALGMISFVSIMTGFIASGVGLGLAASHPDLGLKAVGGLVAVCGLACVGHGIITYKQARYDARMKLVSPGM